MIIKPMRGSTLIIVASMTIVLAILLALGTWQVRRLHWKEALIERVNDRLEGEPRPILEVAGGANGETQSVDYTPVTLTGTFQADFTFFEFTTYKGQSGWNLFNFLKSDHPSQSNGSLFIAVNRGFIPYDARNNWQDIARLPEGVQTITGLLRIPPDKKPGSFMPDNEPKNGTYYWRDIKTMAAAAKLNPEAIAPYYVDEGIPGKSEPLPGAFPKSGTTIISFPNNHLQYAVTWYGLALALLGVGTYFLYARRITKPASSAFHD